MSKRPPRGPTRVETDVTRASSLTPRTLRELPSRDRLPCRLLLAFLLAALPALSGLAHEDPPETPGDPGEAAANQPCRDGRAGIYPCHDVDLVAFLPRNEMGLTGVETISDIWGWTDTATGVEYALVGMSTGTAFVSLANPAAPRWLGTLPTRTLAAPWRDLKVYRDHMYVVADVVQHGLQVFDLTRLRGVASPRSWTPDVSYAGPGFGALGGFSLGNVHNIAIDEASGFAYAVGSNTCNAGLHMIDLSQPRRPRFAGCFEETGYIHDTQCVAYRGPDAAFAGRQLCFNANVASLSIADVTDKRSPRLVANLRYPGAAYAHQGWLTEDHRYFLLGDELDELQNGHRARTYVFDVRDLANPRLAGTYTSPEPVTDHNLYVRGDFVYQANYFAGLRILEMENLAQGRLHEVAYFDTVPDRQEVGFGGGSWSVYPFFPSGLVVVSSVAEGLFVLRPRLDQHGNDEAAPAERVRRRRELREGPSGGEDAGGTAAVRRRGRRGDG